MQEQQSLIPLIEAARYLDQPEQITHFFEFLENLKFDIYQPLFPNQLQRDAKLNYIEHISTFSDSNPNFLLHLLLKAKNANALGHFIDAQRLPHDFIYDSIDQLDYFAPCQPRDYTTFCFSATPINHYLHWVASFEVIPENSRKVLIKVIDKLLDDAQDISQSTRNATIAQLCLIANKYEKKQQINVKNSTNLSKNLPNFSQEFCQKLILLIKKNDLNQFSIPLANNNEVHSFFSHHGLYSENIEIFSQISAGFGSTIALQLTSTLTSKNTLFDDVFVELFKSLKSESFSGSFLKNVNPHLKLNKESAALHVAPNVLCILAFSALTDDSPFHQKSKPLSKKNQILTSFIVNNIGTLLLDPIEDLTLSKAFNFNIINDTNSYCEMEDFYSPTQLLESLSEMNTFEAIGFSFANNNPISQKLVPIIIKQIKQPHFNKERSKKILNNLINGFVIGAKTLAPIEFSNFTQNTTSKNATDFDDTLNKLKSFNFPDLYTKNLQTIYTLSELSACTFTEKFFKNFSKISTNNSLPFLFITQKLFELLEQENKQDDPNILKIMEKLSLETRKCPKFFVELLDEFHYQIDILYSTKMQINHYEQILKTFQKNAKYLPQKTIVEFCRSIEISLNKYVNNDYNDNDSSLTFSNLTKSYLELITLDRSIDKPQNKNANRNQKRL